MRGTVQKIFKDDSIIVLMHDSGLIVSFNYKYLILENNLFRNEFKSCRNCDAYTKNTNNNCCKCEESIKIHYLEDRDFF